MGLFDRFLGRKPPAAAPAEAIQSSVALLADYARAIRDHFGEENFHGDSQAKQILSVYCFGGVSALAMEHKMSVPQGHAVCLALLTTHFGFSPEDSAAKAQALITAAADRTSHLYAIIHRGLDGFLHWQEHRDDGAARDFAEIMSHFQKKNA